MSGFADSLTRNDGRIVLVELVPWAGPLQDDAGERNRAMAQDLAADERVTAITITDNAGGRVRLGPQTFGRAITDMGGEIVVHLSCRDRSRASLESVAYGLASEGLTNVLALSGDYPQEGYGGLSRPVFDIDSVGLLAMLRHLSSDGPPFTAGAAVNPFKALEADLVPQLLKLQLKARAGAAFAINQVGWDPRSMHELLRWSTAAELDIAHIASVFVLSQGVADVFHRNAVPGIRMSDDLLSFVQRGRTDEDKGRARFLELAAKQVAVARGLGYAGVYVGGLRDTGELDVLLRDSEAMGRDWASLLSDVSFPEPDPSRLFEPGDHPQLASDHRLEPTIASRPPTKYRLNRLVHGHVFEPASAGFDLGRRFYERAESMRLGRPLHVLEQAAKVPQFGCADCGDCSLPEIAFQCPESACAKNQRNGPCGGTIDGECEVPGKRCVWTNAYDWLKPYGEALEMLDREPVLQDNALHGTSAWANTFLGRDHYGHGDDEEDL